MSNSAFRSGVLAGALAVAVSLSPTNLLAGAAITIVNMDGPAEGFNDPTPVTPVGGNPGTTLGAQRLLAFQHAAGIWGTALDSAVEIRIQASFDPLTCAPTSATLGSAGAIQIFSDFPGATASNTWHHAALANRLAGQDLAPGEPGTAADDLLARFNSDLDNTNCLGEVGWYYGLDNNHGPHIDLVVVLLHEFGHGLGFANFANKTTGTQPLDLTDVYSRHTLDTTTGKTWEQMTATERAISATNSGKVVWNGPIVTAQAPSVLQPGTPVLRVTAPPSVAGVYAIGTAAFGPPLSSPGVTGPLVLATDGTAPTGNGCEALVNGAAIAGNIAVIDRGTCTFVTKVKNAQTNGALAVIIVNNAAGPAPGLGGADPTITIPSASISLADGNRLKAALALGPVTATLGVDLTILAGADAAGRVRLNAPNPVQPGSSISHWDPSTFPNQLMEPSINDSLTHNVTAPWDLTLALLRDIGWYPDADLDGVADDQDCNPHSDLSATVIIEGCDSGVPNTLFASGCTVSDLIAQRAAGARNHGEFVSSVADLTNALKTQGLLTGDQKGALQSCAAKATRP